MSPFGLGRGGWEWFPTSLDHQSRNSKIQNPDTLTTQVGTLSRKETKGRCPEIRLGSLLLCNAMRDHPLQRKVY